jgi:hypothetical protein
MHVTNCEYIDIQIECAAKKTDTKFRLKLLDINEDQIEVRDPKVAKPLLVRM